MKSLATFHQLLATIMDSEANLTSFVLRFVSEQSTDEQVESQWHGIIRHVQTNQERAFMRWAEAVAFIEQYIDLDENETAKT